MKDKVFRVIAQQLARLENPPATADVSDVEDRVNKIVADHLPSGSGIDTGTKLDFDKSSSKKLVFYLSYHHMTEGMYDGWTDHTVIVTPSLVDSFEMRITGRDRNDVKEYLFQTYDYDLRKEIEL